MSRRAPLLFNPRLLGDQELEATFVARSPLVDGLIADLAADAEGASPRQWLIVAPRGSGKSHLTEVVARRLRREGWAVARLPEEHLRVATLPDLLEQMVILIGGGRSPFERERDPQVVEDRALDWLRGRRRQQPILLVVENLHALLRKFSNRDQHRLRQLLQRDPPFLVLATSPIDPEPLRKETAPFYDFFQERPLDELTQEEVVALVQARAEWAQDADLLADPEALALRARVLYHLSGGNPRVAVALYAVLREGVDRDLYEALLELLDKVSAYYQARLNDISDQGQLVLMALGSADRLLTPSEVGARCRMRTNQVTANLKRLADQRLVRPAGRPDGRRRYWEITDRLFRIWLQMREGATTREQLRWLVEAYRAWYASDPASGENAASRIAEQYVENLRAGRFADAEWRLRSLDALSEALQMDFTLTVLGAMPPGVSEALDGLHGWLGDDPDLGRNLARQRIFALIMEGRREEAAGAARASLRRDPADGVLWALLATLDGSAIDEAVSAVVALEDSAPTALVWLSIALAEHGRVEALRALTAQPGPGRAFAITGARLAALQSDSRQVWTLAAGLDAGPNEPPEVQVLLKFGVAPSRASAIAAAEAIERAGLKVGLMLSLSVLGELVLHGDDEAAVRLATSGHLDDPGAAWVLAIGWGERLGAASVLERVREILPGAQLEVPTALLHNPLVLELYVEAIRRGMTEPTPVLAALASEDIDAAIAALPAESRELALLLRRRLAPARPAAKAR